jgi:hypothetical protein
MVLVWGFTSKPAARVCCAAGSVLLAAGRAQQVQGTGADSGC